MPDQGMTDRELIKKLEDALRDRNREIERLRGALDESCATVSRLLEAQLRNDFYRGEG